MKRKNTRKHHVSKATSTVDDEDTRAQLRKSLTISELIAGNPNADARAHLEELRRLCVGDT